MRPLDDWIEVKLYNKQRSAVEVELALPDGIKREDVDDAAVFEILSVGPWLTDSENAYYNRVMVGDLVQLTNFGDFAQVKLPNGRRTIVGRASHVCFIVEPNDLKEVDV